MMRGVALSEAQAKELARWQYEPPYDLYNFLSWDEMVNQQWSLCSALGRREFIAYVNEEDELLAFVRLVHEGDHLFLGIGVNPSCVNQKIGRAALKDALLRSKAQFGTLPIRLEVRSWNTRAIKCYEACGFKFVGEVIQRTYAGEGHFNVMVYDW